MKKMLLKPKHGWSKFEFFDEMEDILIENLGLKELGNGNWLYQSFTNWNQRWELDIDSPYRAVVDLHCNEDDCERIQSLSIEISTENYKDIPDLEKLFEILRDRLGIEAAS